MRTWGLLLAFGVPVAIDVWTCALALRRNRRGAGPSGLPMVTLLLYAIAIVAAFRDELLLCVGLFVAAAAFHVGLVIGIPLWHRARLERTRGRQGRAP